MGLENRKKSGRLNGGSKMVVVGQGGFTQIKPVSQSSKGNIPQNDKFALNGGIPPCNLNEGKINLDFRIDNTEITSVFFYSEIDPNYRKNTIFAVAYDPIDTEYKFKYFGINGETIDEPKLNQSPLESFSKLTSFSRINGNRFLISGNLTFENNYGMCVINQFGYIVNTIDFNITDYAAQVKYIHSSVDKDGKFIIVGMSDSIEKCVYVYKTQGKVPSFYRQQIYRFNSNGEYDRTFKSVDSKQNEYNSNLFQPQSFSLNGVYVTNQNEYVVYGKFVSYSSKTSNNIIILDTNGFPKFNSFEDYVNNTVSDVVMDYENNLYVVGSFNEYKSVPCKGIVKIPNVNTPEQQDMTFQNNLPSFLSGKRINSISIDSDGGLLITGNFDSRYCKLTNEGKLVESFGDTYTFTNTPTSLLKSMNKGYFLFSTGLKYIDDNQNIYQSIIKLKGC
jgi:hypothetical protein